jgi:toxin ParE1/3/4
VTRRVILTRHARADLRAILTYVAERTDPDRALAYVERIDAYCRSFAEFPVRGTACDEIRLGLRSVGFERRVTIAFHFDDGTVYIDRILYGGRDLGAAFD